MLDIQWQECVAVWATASTCRLGQKLQKTKVGLPKVLLVLCCVIVTRLWIIGHLVERQIFGWAHYGRQHDRAVHESVI